MSGETGGKEATTPSAGDDEARRGDQGAGEGAGGGSSGGGGAKRLVVSGRVQNVGYRAACARTARQLGVAGQVRNLDDGRVEVVVGGDPAAVTALVDWCRHGPKGARVRRVHIDDWAGEFDPAGGFTVRQQ